MPPCICGEEATKKQYVFLNLFLLSDTATRCPEKWKRLVSISRISTLKIFAVGANGSHINGSLESELGRKWHTTGTVGDIQIVQKKNFKESAKLPEESHTPNRIYAVFNKKGNDVQAIAKYGPDGKKIWEIHTRDHNDLGPHYHPCENGHPKTFINNKGHQENVTYNLDSYKKSILEKVRNYGN